MKKIIERFDNMKQYIEDFNGVKIRMLQDENGTVWAVLRDIMEGLGRNHDMELARTRDYVIEIYEDEGLTTCEVLVSEGKRKQIQEHICIIEDAIYNVIAKNKPSKHRQKNDPDALEKWKSFNKFISNLIKEYRTKYNLGIFEMYEKEHQKQQMARVKNTLEEIEKQEAELNVKIPKNNYAIINKQVNQIVCEYLKIPYCLKEKMSIEQRKFRIKILREYVDTFEYTQSKGETNGLIRWKYRLEQKGTGKKMFKKEAM